MKCFFKIFSCLFVLLISCIGNDDDNDNFDITEQRANPVFGVWYSYYPKTDSLVMIRIFTSDFYSYFSFAEGKLQNEYNKQSYTIYNNQLVLEKYVQTFEIEKDTLWITNSLRDQITKYIRMKSYNIVNK